MEIDVFEIRRLNLIKLTEKRGKAAELAGKVDSAASYISTLKKPFDSDVKDPKKSRRMGEELARRIEEVEGLPYGWMDQIHDQQEEGSGTEKPRVIAAGVSQEELAAILAKHENAQIMEILQMAMKLKDTQQSH